MRLATILKLNKPLLSLVTKYKLSRKDMEYLPLYYEYRRLRFEERQKYEYVMHVLMEKYGISISKIKRILAKFNQEIDEYSV